MANATAVEAVMVVEVQNIDGVLYVITKVEPDSYDEYKDLPAAVAFDGVLLGKSGWNSDTGRVCYRSNCLVAPAARAR